MCLVLWDTPTAACDMMGSMAASPFSADRGESTQGGQPARLATMLSKVVGSNFRGSVGTNMP